MDSQIALVEQHEPYCLRYDKHKDSRPGKLEDYIMIELFASQEENSEKHLQTPYFKRLFETFDAEGIIARPAQMFKMHRVAGFESRT